MNLDVHLHTLVCQLSRGGRFDGEYNQLIKPYTGVI